MPKPYINTLVHLAMVDGRVSDSELILIRKIAVAKGVSYFELDRLIQNPEILDLDASVEGLSEDELFEYLYSIVLLMKMDGKLDEKEIEFCQKCVGKLGYKKDVVEVLAERIESDHELSENKEALKKLAHDFLKS
ncbi:MAG: TerB family tellurite resistance protein [Cyclobacteriaceae bacterium]